MAPFADLLAASRLVTLAGRRAVLPSEAKGSPVHPTEQTITTTPRAYARGEWGLKRTMPAALKTHNITMTALDTFEHQTEFTSANNQAKLLEFFQDINLRLSLHSSYAAGSQKLPRGGAGGRGASSWGFASMESALLGYSGAGAVPPRRQNNLLEMERNELRNFIASMRNKRDAFPSAASADFETLKQFVNASDAAHGDREAVHPTGGLLYGGNNFLSSKPPVRRLSGDIIATKPIKARLYGRRDQADELLVGIGGIVARVTPSRNFRRFMERFELLDVYVRSATIKPSGELDIVLSTTPVSNWQQNRARQINSKSLQSWSNMFRADRQARDQPDNEDRRLGSSKAVLDSLAQIIAHSRSQPSPLTGTKNTKATTYLEDDKSDIDSSQGNKKGNTPM